MSLIDRFMPEYSLREVDRVAVTATAERAYEVARHVDFQRLASVRFLFGLRTLPDRLVAALRRRPLDAPTSSRIEDITRPGSGFALLGEEQGREVVVGSVGQFWQPVIPFASVPPEGFATFTQPGFGKLAWCLKVDDRIGGGAWIGIDLRVGATDPDALARFRVYWRLIGRFSRAMRRGLLRTIVRELGAADEEARPLPGDGILPHGQFQRTHAVTIEAPVDRVWPWLVQMGCRRGGWYSFDRLDNGGVPSATRIVPELQHLSVGDIIPARPDGPDGFAVMVIEPSTTLVLGSPSLMAGSSATGRPGWRTTWAFHVEPIGDAAARLAVRVRADYRAGWRMAVMRMLMGTTHEVMERRQLQNLRWRAESLAPA